MHVHFFRSAALCAQLYTGGVGKSTHAASDAPAALKWMQKHLPVSHDVGAFGGCVENAYCRRGQTGRVELLTPAVGRLGYGLHAVHTNRSSARALGDLAIASIEVSVKEKLHHNQMCTRPPLITVYV